MLIRKAVNKVPREYYIYLVLSQTPSKFGKVIRHFANIKYNHASIAFDEELRQLYSFGRRQNKVPLNAGLVKEYPERFSLKKVANVNVRIYRIPVSREQYALGKKRIRQIKIDPDGYLYNLFSVLCYPLFRGFHTYKAYTCAEFTAHMLQFMEIALDDSKLEHQYTPEEIGSSLNQSVFFEGNLLDYCPHETCNTGIFFDSPRYIQATKITVTVLFRLLYRKIRYRSQPAIT